MDGCATTGIFLVDPFLQILVVVKGALFAKFGSDGAAAGVVFLFLGSAEPTTKPALLARLLGILLGYRRNRISK